MGRVSYYNDTDRPVHVGPVMVMPKQSRMVEQADLGVIPEPPEAEDEPHPLQALIDLPLKDLEAALETRRDALDLTPQDLEALKVLETAAEDPRKGAFEMFEQFNLILAGNETRLTEVITALDAGGDDAPATKEQFDAAIEQEESAAVQAALAIERDLRFSSPPE